MTIALAAAYVSPNALQAASLKGIPYTLSMALNASTAALVPVYVL